MELTKQEKIAVSLIRGQHLEPKELAIAKQMVHGMKLQIESLTPKS